MAKRRTKKQKKKALKRRVLGGSKSINLKKKERVVDYGYNPELIKKDLGKTILISLIILAIEFGLYFFVFK